VATQAMRQHVTARPPAPPPELPRYVGGIR
jgi:hypothetical protein